MSKPELKPFFTVYGGKWRAAPLYPPPAHEVLIEPFAGSAGYALRHPGHRVWLNDLDDAVVATWRYLLTVSAEEILGLPDIGPDQTVDDLTVAPEARLLVGWWLNKGSSTPKRRPSTFMLRHAAGAPYLGAAIRERIAGQLEYIRHWRVTQMLYQDLPNIEATWFVDPPYVHAGHHYRHHNINYARLARWCRTLHGQAIVCEADDASWLPFQPLALIDGTEGRQKRVRARQETVWLQARHA